MAQNYSVQIYPAAKQDLLNVIESLNTLSVQAALRYYDLLMEKIASLSDMPNRCPRPRDLVLAAKGYRYLIVEEYLVFFMVKENVVQVHRILFGRSDYQSIL